ncbi:MAG: hypothetical protein LBM98_10200 [Oscillospiraceae bacterium]|nr:hypothetical protein [Oscillospiraceae bacterium]
MPRAYTLYVSHAFRRSQRRRTAPGRNDGAGLAPPSVRCAGTLDVRRGRAGLKPAPTLCNPE